MDGLDQAPVAHGGDGVDLVDGAARLGVGGRGRPGGLAELRLQYHLNKDKNGHSISRRGDIMHNIHADTDIDGIDQAPVAHGGGAARLEVGGRGRGLDGDLRHQYHLNKNGHNISRRGDIMHNIHVDTADIDGVDQDPAAHWGRGATLLAGAARPEVGTVLAIKTPFGPGDITRRAATSAKLKISS